MRLTAPAIGGAAVALATALVWYFRQGTEPQVVSDDDALSVQPASVASEAAERVTEPEAPAVAPVPAAAVVAVAAASAMPAVERAPLPGEAPSTPMANLLTHREEGPPPGLIEGEREFAAEPVDATWAPGAEADMLAKFAQMPGLTLIDLQVECRSTMCRLQLTQPSGAPPVQGGPRPFNILLDSVGMEPRWMIAIGRQAEPMRSVAYLWRDGFAPPKLAAGQPNETN
jgi:hypothetical protein